MENTFLPNGYEKPASEGRYYKLQQGDNKFRILSSAIVGWVDWKEEGGKKVPVRTKDKPERSVDPKKPAKHFWAFVIYSYNDKAIRIMELTQATIQDAIINLHQSADWGNPMEYDINIKKTGEKMETKYSVVPTPPKPLSEEVKKEYSDLKIDLNKLYTNEDPFSSSETFDRLKKASEAVDVSDADLELKSNN